jgi:hypothetical protein
MEGNNSTPEAEYEAAVEEGKAILAAIGSKQWTLGDLADTIETVYGANRLAQFAEDINFDGAVSTLERCRDVCRAFPKGRGRPRFFGVAQILATHPDRFRIVKDARTSARAKRVCSWTNGTKCRRRLKTCSKTNLSRRAT